MALVVTGCPHNQYIVELKPRGNSIERTLVFYREDGTDANTGATNYKAFDEAELAAITSVYPAHGLTNDGLRYTAKGEFTRALPGDIGGAGSYTNLTTSLGGAGFYVERFRGNDDLAAMIERRFKAADQLTEMALGWSRMELGKEAGYDKLRQFLDVDFRRDLKNLSMYGWAGQAAGASSTNAVEESAVRFGHYLFERGYFTMEEIPRLLTDFSEGETEALLPKIQRLLARKMGVPEAQPVPPSLDFLSTGAMLGSSFNKYATNADLYLARLKQWEGDKKLKPDTEKPDPSQMVSDAIEQLLSSDATVFGDADHLAVRLSLPSPPDHSNGRWDAALKQVIWETDMEERGDAAHVPFTCYASWAKPDQESQTKHFGRVILTGEKLTQYCLWRSSQNEKDGGEWDAFVANLQPGDDLEKKLEGFRFSHEPHPVGPNDQNQIPGPSDVPRGMLKDALELLKSELR
jgi:hypothetical protein